MPVRLFVILALADRMVENEKKKKKLLKNKVLKENMLFI